MICVGTDVAKDKHDYFILSSEGVALTDAFTIPNNPEGFNTLLNIPGYMDAGVGNALLHSFYAILGIAASAAAVLVFYNAHITALWLLRMALQRAA